MSKQTVSRILREVISSPLLAPLLAGINTPLVLSAKNAFMFTNAEFAQSLAIFTCAFAGLSLVITGILEATARVARLSTDRRKRLLNVVLAGVAVLLFVYLSHDINRTIIPRSAVLWAVYAAGGVVVMRHVLRNGTAVLNVILLILNLIAVGQLTWEKQKEYQLCRTMDKEISATSGELSHIRFERKPNVYLIVMESYQDNRTLKDIYNFDNSPFTASLTNKGFSVYGNAFANYDHTLPSVLALFLARHHYYSLSQGNLDGPGMRQIIGGRSRNPTLEAFKENGYMVQYLHRSSYCYLDSPLIDYSYANSAPLRFLELIDAEPMKTLYEKWRARRFAGFLTTVQERVATAIASHRPYFSFIKIDWPGHTPPRWDGLPEKTRKKLDSRAIFKATPWKLYDYWPQVYAARIDASSRMLMSVVDPILSRDPEAAIIIMGDHGAYRYRGVIGKTGDPNDAALACNVPLDALAEDKFGILCAVKWPSGQTNEPVILSPITIFPRLFESLTPGRHILMPDSDNLSIVHSDKLYVAVRDGQILSPWPCIFPPAKASAAKGQ